MSNNCMPEVEDSRLGYDMLMGHWVRSPTVLFAYIQNVNFLELTLKYGMCL
jgi:hypothetical protein